ncbi:MAG: ribonuclease III [Acidobacteriaceae bacterium]|nr:ribonuclease III [Acidobacteriaceae bacterium]
MTPALEALEEKIGYHFRDRDLFLRALTHRSWLSERGSPMPETGDNEQLEFLGDSVLGFVVSEALVLRHPVAREGQLSQWKAHLVSSTHLYACALTLGLGDFLLLGKGEDRNGGRQRRTVLANAFEALIAAMLVDGGINVARKFVEEHVLRGVNSLRDVESMGLLNHKSVLQERTQALGLPAPRYSTVDSSGPEHAKVFTVEVRVGDRFTSRATGNSKKAAGQQAAERLIQQLGQSEASPITYLPERSTDREGRATHGASPGKRREE